MAPWLPGVAPSVLIVSDIRMASPRLSNWRTMKWGHLAAWLNVEDASVPETSHGVQRLKASDDCTQRNTISVIRR